jgi:hypothetical protein
VAGKKGLDDLSELTQERTAFHGSGHSGWADSSRKCCETSYPILWCPPPLVRAWQEREPQTWAMVCDWLAAQGKSVVQV